MSKNKPNIILNYWRYNLRPDYIEGHSKSKFLVKIFNRFIDRDLCIRELGCNVGRNLKYLEQAGYKFTEGIEVNPIAIKNKICKSDIIETSIENYYLSKKGYSNVIFTMACFQHIPYNNDFVFELIQNASNMIITIENERHESWNHFPRNYQRVFTGMKQIYKKNCWNIKGLGRDFICRIFIK